MPLPSHPPPQHIAGAALSLATPAGWYLSLLVFTLCVFDLLLQLASAPRWSLACPYIRAWQTFLVVSTSPGSGRTADAGTSRLSSRAVAHRPTSPTSAPRS